MTVKFVERTRKRALSILARIKKLRNRAIGTACLRLGR